MEKEDCKGIKNKYRAPYCELMPCIYERIIISLWELFIFRDIIIKKTSGD